MKWLTKLFKSDSSLKKIVDQINALEAEVSELTNEGLRQESDQLRSKVKGLRSKEELDEALPRAFALVRETAKRTLGQRHFDVQLMAGIALHQGSIVEMRTGEGKTLSSTAPVYLNALTGKGAHVVTVNEYLAKRDAVWMGQIYHALGLSVACLVHEGARMYDPRFLGRHPERSEGSRDSSASPQNDREALLDKERDLTGGFRVQDEYLRPISRKEAYQVDILYGTNHEFGFDYLRDNLAHSVEGQVQKKQNYAIIDEVDSILIDEARTPLIISAPDTASSDYYKTFARVVRGMEDETDYIKDEKRKALEITESGIEKVEKMINVKNLYAPENLRLTHYLQESLRAKALFHRDKDYVVKNGEITLVDQFTGRLLPGRRFSGGLHQALEAKEGLRVQNESRTYASISIQNYFRMYEKLSGMTGTAQTSAEEFDKVYGLGVVTIPTNRPMVRDDMPDLVYKTSDAKWEAVINDVKERQQKGQPILIGTVSIEKNEQLDRLLSRAGIAHETLNAKNNEREGAIIAQAGKPGAVTVATNMAGRGVDIILGGNPPLSAESAKVREAGGLHVIGTERHESRRIDNQLRGRAGRQGDPGSSQFFLSLEDDLMRVFGGDRIKGIMTALKVPEDMPISAKMVNRSVNQAQAKVEGFNFDARKHLIDYDDVLNKQRAAIYLKRQNILGNSVIVYGHPERSERSQRDSSVSPQNDKKELKLSPHARRHVLAMLDALWMGHLENMEALRESVRLRAYGQHDPLVEYRKEGRIMYEQLLADFDKWIEENREKLTQINTNENTDPHKNEVAQHPGHVLPPASPIQGGPADPNASLAESRWAGKIGRNDPCHCGAKREDGKPKKYKHCHGKNV